MTDPTTPQGHGMGWNPPQLPEDSIHPPTADNPSPSKGLKDFQAETKPLQVPDELREQVRGLHRKYGRRVDTDFMNDLMELFAAHTAKAVAEALDKAEDALLDRSIALENEETAVKWDDVVEVLNHLKEQQGGL